MRKFNRKFFLLQRNLQKNFPKKKKMKNLLKSVKNLFFHLIFSLELYFYLFLDLVDLDWAGYQS